MVTDLLHLSSTPKNKMDDEGVPGEEYGGAPPGEEEEYGGGGGNEQHQPLNDNDDLVEGMHICFS